MSSILDGNLMMMGWYMRRTADSHELGDFYTDVIGLPMLRGGRPWPVTMYWSGDATVFELKSDEEPMPERDQNPDTAPCTPIFRVYGLNGLVARLRDKGVEIVREEQLKPGQRQAVALDTDSQLIAFRETERGAGNAIDEEAWRRRDAGYSFDPGCGAMPADIQVMDGVVMRVADLAKMREFYTKIVGFPMIESTDEVVTFDLGDNTFLELRPGGHEVPVPKDRVEITNSFILRLQDTEAFKQHVKAHGVHFPNEHIQWKRAHLAYFADPEGRIIGIEQRYDPKDYLEDVEIYPEDIETERRFAARNTQA